MTITDAVRKYAAEQGIAEEEALKMGMEDLSIVHRDAMHEMSQTYLANQKHRLAMAGETKHIQQHESGRTKKVEG